MNYLNNFFKISESGSSISTEIRAGIATFLSMSYIVFVNPMILSKTGMDANALFSATILATVVGTIAMGLFANWPIALAPAMGTNAWFAFGIVLGLHHSWQEALVFTFISGLLMVVFTILPIRAQLINVMSDSLKHSITAAVGLFIGVIGLKTSGVFVTDEVTFANLGNVLLPNIYLTFLGLAVIFFCEAYKIKGSIVISIVVISIISLLMGITNFQGILAAPPSIVPISMHLDFSNVLSISGLSIIVVLFIMDFFDSTSLFMSVSGQLPEKKSNTNFKQALLVDGFATSIGALLGVSTVTAYAESVSGMKEGGKTGLTSVIVGCLFIMLLFFSPLIKVVPYFAAAPAMIYISCIMFSALKDLKWESMIEVIPAAVMIITVTLTFSVFNGVGLGVTTWVVLKVFNKEWERKHLPILMVSLLFIVYIIIR